MEDGTQHFIERAFWWLVGIFGTLFTAAATGLIGALWSMNASIVTLNERVGSVIERSKTFEHDLAEMHEEMRALWLRIRSTDDTPPTRKGRP